MEDTKVSVPLILRIGDVELKAKLEELKNKKDEE